jgi:excinuclease ABC subunit B
VNGTVIMYADTVTKSMRRAVEETERRRAKQVAYNEAHGITPQSVQRRIFWIEQAEEAARRIGVERPADLHKAVEDPREAGKMIEKLRKEMTEAAKRLEFEKAAELRDRIRALRAVLGTT